MKRRKVGFVPGKSGNADKIAEQEPFQVEILEPLVGNYPGVLTVLLTPFEFN